MNTCTRLPLVAVALAIVAGVLFGTLAGGDEAVAATQHTLRIPASAFAPRWHATEYLNTGASLQYSGSFSKAFHAPVLLQGNSATIQSVQMHYTDIDSGQICLSVIRQTLKTGVEKTMSQMCTRNAVSGTRTRTDTTIQPDAVSAGQAVYLYVTLPSGMYALEGVTIIYTADG